MKTKFSNHFQVPPGGVGNKTKRIKRKRSHNILLRPLCFAQDRLALNIRTDPPSHRDYILWQRLTNEGSQLSPPNCRSHPPLVSRCCCCCVVGCFCPTGVVSAVAAWAGTESCAGASSSMQGSPISQYANWIKCREVRSVDILTKLQKVERSKRLTK